MFQLNYNGNGEISTLGNIGIYKPNIYCNKVVYIVYKITLNM